MAILKARSFCTVNPGFWKVKGEVIILQYQCSRRGRGLRGGYGGYGGAYHLVKEFQSPRSEGKWKVEMGEEGNESVGWGGSLKKNSIDAGCVYLLLVVVQILDVTYP